MTPLAHIALDFCRECLGWEDVREDGIGIYVYCHPERPNKLLSFTDLNAVMDAVRGWCDENDTAVEIGYYGYIPGEWEVQAATPISLETIQSGDLCQALLAACVEARRKLKAAG